MVEFQSLTCWVGSLKPSVTPEELFDAFGAEGIDVEDVNLTKDKSGRGLDSFAFVDFLSEEVHC